MKKLKYPRVKGYIMLAGYSLDDAAAKLGITTRTLYNKLNGKSEFTLLEAMEIKRIAGKSIEDIFFSEDVA